MGAETKWINDWCWYAPKGTRIGRIYRYNHDTDRARESAMRIFGNLHRYQCAYRWNGEEHTIGGFETVAQCEAAIESRYAAAMHAEGLRCPHCGQWFRPGSQR